MNGTRVKVTVTYADGTERAAYMNVESAKNLVGNAGMDDSQIRKIELEYVEDAAYKYQAIVAGLNTSITALYQKINSLRAMELDGTLSADLAGRMIEQNESAITECKKLLNAHVKLWEKAKNEKFLVILGADVDMEKASKQGFINIKER